MLLGGPPRCGKTLLGQRVASELGIGWLSTDTIRDVVNMLMPALYESGGPGVDPGPEADLFFPYFERAVESCNYLVDDYLIEVSGSCLDMSRRWTSASTRVRSSWECRTSSSTLCSRMKVAIDGIASWKRRSSPRFRHGSSRGACSSSRNARSSTFRTSISAPTFSEVSKWHTGCCRQTTRHARCSPMPEDPNLSDLGRSLCSRRSEAFECCRIP
jgi:hypothetical protein